MKRPSKLPPLELVEYIFDYDPISGNLIRKQTGKAITNNDRTSGYCKVRIGKLTTQASRIAWYLFYREDPIGYIIEHKDGCKNNNQITNLRKVKYKL